MTTVNDVERNFVRLREKRAEAEARLASIEEQVSDADVVFVAVKVFEAGFHPFRGQGRALTENLVRRHRAQEQRPLIPAITHVDVDELAESFDIPRDFEPTRRFAVV